MAGELFKKIKQYPLMKEQKKLFLPNISTCILMDLVGMLSYALPAIGETFDLVWAPISGLVFYKLFGGRLGLIGGVLDFLEEILPFTDVIPSFTIAWFIRKNAMEDVKVENEAVQKTSVPKTSFKF